ncbi:MAG: ferrous iron transporter B, partial [Clostridia bacterium]|nr:ferrous iron transporter B [Clostridia bacterium]
MLSANPRLLEITYGEPIEKAVAQIEKLLTGTYVIMKRSIALLLLLGDEDMANQVRKAEGDRYEAIVQVVKEAESQFDMPLNYVISVERYKISQKVVKQVVTQNEGNARTLSGKLSAITMHPVFGSILLLLVLYFGLYQFVGVFGAGTVVNFLENSIFGKFILPPISHFIEVTIPWDWLKELLARQYGILTLGIRYAIAIVLPIVGTFFLMFSVIEDTGYLPRIAMLVDRVFKKIGLNGRAVIPMTLGFGCDTMATMVSRTLETKRERFIATLLLSLAIPCSAQLGVILALLSGHPLALLIWVFFIVLVFLLVGFLTAKLMPGESPTFYMEVPPLRLPKLSNVLVKTYTRMQWYFIEILPLFIIASVLIWIGNITGLFHALVTLIEPVVRWIGLPNQAAEMFLFGFFRRDYGAAGLYDLQKAGLLSIRQLVVSSVTLTLFVPCIAQFAMTIKVRGLKAALGLSLIHIS